MCPVSLHENMQPKPTINSDVTSKTIALPEHIYAAKVDYGQKLELFMLRDLKHDWDLP